jgi:hypothetical protein
MLCADLMTSEQLLWTCSSCCATSTGELVMMVSLAISAILFFFVCSFSSPLILRLTCGRSYLR